METINIKELIPNKDNPRFIRDTEYQKLLTSIQKFPSMLNLRKVIVDENMVIQGGNMRYRACVELGYKEVPFAVYTREMYKKDIQARKKLAKEKGEEYEAETYEQLCQEFVVKDNLEFGQWDWDILANTHDSGVLVQWGMPEHLVDKSWEDIEFIDKAEKPESNSDVTIKLVIESEYEDIEPELRNELTKLISRFNGVKIQ